MRCSSEVVAPSSGLSIVMPVVFGDNGAAIMGAGTECRFGETSETTCKSSANLLRVGVRESRSA